MLRTFGHGAAIAAATLVFGIAGATAAEKTPPSPCKGLVEATCKADANCSWVKARKGKDGKDVAGFCRKKPAKKAAPAATPAAPKT